MGLLLFLIVTVVAGVAYARRVCDAYARAGVGVSAHSRFGVVVRAVLVLFVLMLVGAVAGVVFAMV